MAFPSKIMHYYWSEGMDLIDVGLDYFCCSGMCYYQTEGMDSIYLDWHCFWLSYSSSPPAFGVNFQNWISTTIEY